MGSCNTTRNEKGGKDILLKVCSEIEVDVAITTADDPEALLLTSHGAAVGDLIRFGVEALGTVDDVTAGVIYFVTEVVDADSFKISATPGGTAISFANAVTDLTIELFTTLGGLRTKSWSFGSDGIEVTNHGSNQWRQMLDGAGIKSMSLSGEGVYTSATNFRTVENNAHANTLTCFAIVEIVTGRVYNGCFKITAVEGSADFSGEATYSLSMESADAITITQAA